MTQTANLKHNASIEMADRELWEKRYDTPDLIHGPEASDYLRANAGLLPTSGLALDITAGEGRNSVWLAERGLEVVALDISLRALEKCQRLARARGLVVDVAAVDLAQFEIPRKRFDMIVCFNFLRRELAPQIIEGLKPCGLLIFETLTIEHLRWKPDFNTDYLLQPGELAAMFSSLRLIKYREIDLEITSEGKPSRRSVASIIARSLE
ncbi:MAG TPA: class I SAM-dependent methyltransferase [Blastocatellia bacterium]|nr:class I SAM-dependent methyltransferase [Blastocatellia bacterium]